MKKKGKYYNQAGNGNVVKGQTGLVNILMDNILQVVADTFGKTLDELKAFLGNESTGNQVCVSFNLRKTDNGRYVKGTGNDVLEEFPANVKPGGISITVSQYDA